jgi:hypothetical protein
MIQRLSPSSARIAANVATVAFALAILLQLLLAAGILPISMAWGGTQTVLTPQLRIASLVAAAVLGIFAYIIRRRAGLLGGQPPRSMAILSWVVTAFLSLNMLGNFASSSAGEARLFGPISLVLALSCLLASASRTNHQPG